MDQSAFSTVLTVSLMHDLRQYQVLQNTQT